jgi:hypothetical protein
VKTESFACAPATLVLDNDRDACEHGFRGARFMMQALSTYYLAGKRPIGELPVPREPFSSAEVDEAMRLRNTPGSQIGMVIGDAVAARESVQRLVDVGVDELLLVMQMGTVPHAVIMQSLRTIAEKVIPYFSSPSGSRATLAEATPQGDVAPGVSLPI